MLAAAKFLLIAALLLALAWWIGGLPGDVTAHAGAYTITTSTPAALLLLFLIALLFTIFLRVLGGIGRAPQAAAAWRGARARQAGEVAMQRGMVALAAGDAPAAKAAATKARKLLGDTPMAIWLRAEAARLAGDAAEARAAFAALTAHHEMRFLGHHGLLRASMAAADAQDAARHAANAEDAYPGAAWTRAQRFELALRAKDYPRALGLTQDRQEIAALAVAAARQAGGPHQALRYAQMALKALPGFPPAVVAAAAALRQLDKERAARKTVLAAWRETPQPLLASAWFAPGATSLERAQQAVALAAAKPGHVESETLLAQTALAAGLVAEARRHAEAALQSGEDDGRAQGVLDALADKPRTEGRSAWICESCHNAAHEWSPLCPACARPGTLRWRRLGLALGPSLDSAPSRSLGPVRA